MTAAIEVLEIRPVDNCGNVRAFVKLRLGGLVIHGVKVVSQEGQKAWCALPQTKSGDRWYPVVEITSKPLKERVSAAVLDAWQASRQEVIPPRTQGRDPGQHDTGNPGRPFDDECPF